jgi:hypothetical protein
MPGFGPVTALVAEIYQGIEAGLGDEENAATAATITTIWTAKGDKFFPTKAQGAVPTGTRSNMDAYFINKLHKKPRSRKNGAGSLCAEAGSGHGYDADGTYLARSLALEFYDPFCGGKEGVILADTDVATRIKLGATLTNDDVAGDNQLSGVTFHAQALGF